jgi:hypothetical protein
MVDSRFGSDTPWGDDLRSEELDWFTDNASASSTSGGGDTKHDNREGAARAAFSVVDGGEVGADADGEEVDWFTATGPVFDARPETEAFDKRGDSDGESDDGWLDAESANALEGADTQWVMDPDAGPGVWADSPTAERRSWLRRHRGAVAVTGSVAAVAAVLAGAGSVALGATTPDEARPITDVIASAPAPTTTNGVAAGASRAWCAGFTTGEPITSSSADAGEAAIAAFQDAYYIARDAAKARAQVAEGASVGSAEEMAKFIAETPPGTEHCVLASPRGDGAYAVDLFVRAPGGSATHYPQNVATTPDPDGGARITAITVREGA